LLLVLWDMTRSAAPSVAPMVHPRIRSAAGKRRIR
jgi:hypothetical protein